MKVTIQADLETREALRATLVELMAAQNEAVLAIGRKRAWRPSEKAMAAARHVRRIEHLAVLVAALDRMK